LQPIILTLESNDSDFGVDENNGDDVKTLLQHYYMRILLIYLLCYILHSKHINFKMICTLKYLSLVPAYFVMNTNILLVFLNKHSHFL